jgi:hypothetical protein
MAKRILPYRDYSEHDVLNLFSLDTASYTIADAKSNAAAGSAFDSGVVVNVKTGELPGDLPGGLSEHASGEELRKYLGDSPTSAHIGYNAYPYNGMTVEPAGAGDVAVGITLRETLAYDENGEKLLYYKQKLDEAQAVLPGQTVPVLTRGIVLLSSTAFGSAPGLGDKLEVSATDGKLDTATGGTVVGTVLAKSGSDKFLCKISF